MSKIHIPNGAPTQHTEEEISSLVDVFTAGKVRAAKEDRLLVIFNGTVGAGKTRAMNHYFHDLGPEEKSQTVYCAYDEHGLLFAMKKYRDEIKALRRKHNGKLPHKERMEIRDKYQLDTQYGFALVQQKAIEQGNSLFIDMTMQSKHALSALEPYKKDGRKIILESYISPREIAKERVNRRIRSLWPDEFDKKYDGWFGNFANLVDNGLAIHLHHNPEDGKPPLLVASFNNGAAMDINNEHYTRMVEDLQKQKGQTQIFLKKIEELVNAYS